MANGWRTAAKQPVKNADLWRDLHAAMSEHEVTWHWVKGHAGHPENERADELARAGMAPFKTRPARPRAAAAPAEGAAPKPTRPASRPPRRSTQSY